MINKFCVARIFISHSNITITYNHRGISFKLLDNIQKIFGKYPKKRNKKMTENRQQKMLSNRT